MPIDMPAPIADYFRADGGKDAEAVVRCFAENAVVKDEGHTYVGREAIRAWKADSSKAYTYTVEPFSIATESGRTIITSHLVGDFPGSPVDLRYFFGLADGKIAELEIIL